MSRFDSGLPFPRGATYGDGIATLDAAYGKHLLGNVYEVNDTEHGTGKKVKLMAVKLEANVTIPGTAAIPLHKLYAFGTTALDFGRNLTGTLAGAGVVCVPLDDAYAGAKALLANDVVWALVEGPCSLATGATSVNLAQHAAVASDAVGCVAAAAATAGQFVVGTVDEATTDESTEVVVHVNVLPLKPSEAAG